MTEPVYFENYETAIQAIVQNTFPLLAIALEGATTKKELVRTLMSFEEDGIGVLGELPYLAKNQFVRLSVYREQTLSHLFR